MHKIKIITAIILLAAGWPNLLWSQVVLTFDEVVQISRCDNLSARRAFVEKKNAFWDYQIHRANLRPQLSLNTQIADFTRGVAPVNQEDGSIEFLTVDQNSSNAGLSLFQPIPFLGAGIFLNSYLYRFDNFNSGNHSYSSQPVEAGIQIPLWQFSKLKWDKRIKPIEYLEAKKEYDRNLEQSAFTAVNLFFRNVIDRNEWSMANANMEQNTELYRISQERFNSGKISKDELLQVKLMMVTARKNLKSASVSMENSAMLLITHLSLTNITDFYPVIPDTIPDFQITPAKAVEYAFYNNPESIAFKRRLMEADEEVARTRGATGFSGDVFATVGYGSNFGELNHWNDNLNQHATLQVGLSIPIIDWGRTEAARKKASMNKELEETAVLQEKINFEKEIISLVNTVEMQKENIATMKEAETIARQRYDIAYNRYLVGDLTISELNIAQNEKDYANRDLLSAQGAFWINYYRLRMITLYDFITRSALVTQDEN